VSPLPGFLNVKVLRGVNLVCCDATGSDPYVVFRLDGQVCFLFPISLTSYSSPITSSCPT
jgi:hypothetical protein